MKKSGKANFVSRSPFLGVLETKFLICAILVSSWGFSQEATEDAREEGAQPKQTKAKTFFPSPSATDQSMTSGEIRILDIECTSTRPDVPVNAEKIKQNMRSRVDGVFSPQTVDGDIESLYATGDYTSVQILTTEIRSSTNEAGFRLNVIVTPKVRVSEVEIKRKREDGGFDDTLSVDKEDLLDLKHKALTAKEERGAQALKSAFAPKETVTKAGDMLSMERLQRDAGAMEDFYRDRGFKDVKISFQTEPSEEGQAKVIFEIQEGVRGFIKKIRFLGNQVVSEEELNKAVQMKPVAWWQFLSKANRFEELKYNEDINRIKNLYLNRGYIDVRVEAKLEIRKTVESRDREPAGEPDDVPAADLLITYTIEEGRQYRTGDFTITGNTFFSTDDLLNELGGTRAKQVEILDQTEIKMVKADGLQPGEIYSVNGLQASVEVLQNKYGKRGFRDAVVDPQIEPNVETGKIDIFFKIREGEKFVVERIEIQGNTTTKDKVIRREISLEPGEVFDTTREKESKRRLENMNYFSKVETYGEETDVPGRQNFIVKVEEGNTGDISFGAGFSSVELLTANVTVTERNFDLQRLFGPWPPRGAGQRVKLRASIGFRSQNLSVDFVEPWFLDKPIRLEASGFYNGMAYLSEFYKQQNYGAMVGLVRQLGQEAPLNRWSIGAFYRPEYFNIIDLQSDAPPYMQASTGDTLKSSLTGQIQYDGRDNLMLPRHGQVFEFNAQGAGGPLLGSENIWKLRAEFKTFHLIWPEQDWILSARAEAGVVNSFSSTQYVPIWDNLFAGGAGSVRGFSPAVFGTVNSGSVGPKQNSQPIGGSTSGIYQVEISAPPPFLENLFRVFTFCDGGFVNQNAFDFDPKTYNNTQTMDVNGTPTSFQAVNGGFQIGVGAGIQIIQMIPLKFSFGYPVMTGDPNNRGGVKFYLEGAYNF